MGSPSGGNTGGGSGGNTGSDAGFFISEEQKKKDKKKKEQQINESGYGPDYQGDVNPNVEKKPKKKTPVIIPDNNDNDNYNPTIQEVTETAPTVAEVDQATTNTDATETAETTEAKKKLKIKKKGQSSSIMTSAQGVTKTSSDYSLGKPSLLGRV